MRQFTEQEIEAALRSAPKVIQDELEGGEDTTEVIASIGQSLKLHIDVLGAIAELNRNMLLGLIDPNEFYRELIALQIPDLQAKQIMNQINEKIFMPLQAKMRQAQQLRRPAESEPQPPPPKPPIAPAPPPPRPIDETHGSPRSTNTAPASVQNLAASLHDVIKEVTAKSAPPSAPATPAPLPPRQVLQSYQPPTPAASASQRPQAEQPPTTNIQQLTPPNRPPQPPLPEASKRPAGLDPYREPIE